MRRIDGAVSTVAQAADEEPLQELPSAAFPAELTIERVVAADALVSVWGNRYSVPAELAGTTVEVHPATGTASETCNTPTGANASSMYRDRTGF